MKLQGKVTQAPAPPIVYRYEEGGKGKYDDTWQFSVSMTMPADFTVRALRALADQIDLDAEEDDTALD